jgi:CYTH domain-containing protein
MREIELERTFLVKSIPPECKNVEGLDLLDIYLPTSAVHPVLRIRQRGNKMVITKKQILNGTDSSEMSEDTIPLSNEEYEEMTQLKGKRLHKKRHTFKQKNNTVDIDVYLDDLAGLVVADFEFENIDEKNAFVAPAWCLADVTQEKFIAGGLLAGKKYENIESELSKFSYKKIIIKNQNY